MLQNTLSKVNVGPLVLSFPPPPLALPGCPENEMWPGDESRRSPFTRLAVFGQTTEVQPKRKSQLFRRSAESYSQKLLLSSVQELIREEHVTISHVG